MTNSRSVTAAACAAVVVAGLYAASPSVADPGSPPPVRPVTAALASRPVVQRAGTPVVLGQTAFTGLGSCNGATPFGAVTSASGGGASYTAPSAGVVTSWSTVGGGAAGTTRLLFFVPGALANHRTLVGKSDFMAVPSTFGVVNTFPARIPVQAGWQLGLGISVTGQACAINAGIAGDVIGTQAGFNADAATDMTLSDTAAYRPDISAVLEPDVDGDLYGDISQDLCPQSATTQAACPAPDTVVTKAPKKKSTKRKAKITFSSTIAGSTFTCAVDKLAAVPCTSPFKKKFKYGKHTVVITAKSPAGIVDASPVTVKFKVTKPRH
jgi:hypothetical protein